MHRYHSKPEARGLETTHCGNEKEQEPIATTCPTERFDVRLRVPTPENRATRPCPTPHTSGPEKRSRGGGGTDPKPRTGHERTAASDSKSACDLA